jgi:putative peptidoglycan lipid II flippase
MAYGRTARARIRALITREYSIPEASALFIITFLISASMGLVRQVLFNAQFGAGYEASAFYAAFRLPDTLANLVAGGTLTGALIPVLAMVQHEEGRAAELRLIRLITTVMTAVFAVLIGLGLLFAPLFVRSVLAPGFDEATSALTIHLTRIMLLQSLLGVSSSVVIAVLNTRHQFFLSGVSIVAHNITMISGILAARVVPGLGIYGPALGVVGDAVLQLAILLPGLRANYIQLGIVWDLRDRHLRAVVRLLIPSGLSASVNYAGGIVDTAYGSLARESASLPALQNASLMLGLPLRLLGSAVGQAAFPRLAQLAAVGEWRQLRRTLLRTLVVACGLALPVMAVLLLLGRQAIQIVFERGRFDASAGALTYALLVAYASALPAYVGTDILSRGLVGLRDTTTPLLTNCGQLLGRVAIIAALIDGLGAVAIPIAFAVSSVAETLVLAIVLLAKLRRAERRA